MGKKGHHLQLQQTSKPFTNKYVQDTQGKTPQLVKETNDLG